MDPMFSKMSRGAIPPSLDPSGIQDRRLSLGRTDLNRSMDRMVLDGELDDLGLARGPIALGATDDDPSGLELSVAYVVKMTHR